MTNFNEYLIKGLISVIIFLVAKLVHWFINNSIHRVDKYAERKGLSALDISEASKKTISQFSKYIIYGVAICDDAGLFWEGKAPVEASNVTGRSGGLVADGDALWPI